MHRFTSKGLRQEHLSREIAIRLADEGRILDLGCGDGRLLASAAGAFRHADIFSCDVKKTRQGDGRFVICDGANLPYRGGSFSQVVLSDVVHHCGNPLGVLSEAVRVSSSSVIVKDHISDGPLSYAVLSLMDVYGNIISGDYGVRYLSKDGWDDLFRRIPEIRSVKRRSIRIYGWFSRLFPEEMQAIFDVSKERA